MQKQKVPTRLRNRLKELEGHLKFHEAELRRHLKKYGTDGGWLVEDLRKINQNKTEILEIKHAMHLWSGWK